MIARKTSASATDFRLWLTPNVFVIETVNRLAASVRPNSTTQAIKPALVRIGNRSVETAAVQSSTTPNADMPISNALLFQVLLLDISCEYPCLDGELKRLARLMQLIVFGGSR